MNPTTIASVASAMLLAACGGSGTSSGSSTPVVTPGPGVSTQAVSGTLTIGNPGSTTSSTSRRPSDVSTGTGHVALFIDGATTAAGQTGACARATGTGTVCTITWAAQLSVPAAHVFAVEADTGTNTPANTVLSVGSGSYAIVAGSANALTALSLNAIAAGILQTVNGGCAGVSPNSLCSGTFQVEDASLHSIAYTGATVVPTTGNSPTSGNVYDNGPVTLVSSAPAIGTITGTAQPTFSSLAAGTLTVFGVIPTGTQNMYQVTCGAGTNGTFGFTFGGGLTADTIVTTAELSGLAPAVVFPALGAFSLVNAPVSFTCTNGNITSAGGTLIVN